MHRVFRQLGLDVPLEAARLLLQHRHDGVADDAELFLGRQPVGRAGDRAQVDLLFQPAHAFHIKLVEIRVENREKPEAFEQRRAGVHRLVEHAAIELEPRQLTIEKLRRRRVVEARVAALFRGRGLAGGGGHGDAKPLVGQVGGGDGLR